MFAFKSLHSLARTANLHNISKAATKIWLKPNQRISRRTCTSMSVSEKNAHDFTQYQSAYVFARIQCTSSLLDQLTEALMCFGANSISIDDADADEASDEEASQKSYITAFFPAGEDVGACLALAADSIGLNELPKYEVVEGDSNWVQQVQEIFQPIEITKDIWVIPEWRSPLDPEAVNIVLDPGLAFGTGDHPTTRLCINFLKEFVKTGNTVLDYGTGSGILSIAAIHMGAANVVAIDIDPVAVSSAKRNASLNQFEEEKLQVHLVTEDGNLLSGEASSANSDKSSFDNGISSLQPAQYDLVIANILLNPLLQLAGRITNHVKPGGVVGLSGIITDQVPQIQECYSQYLDDISVCEYDGWACVRGIKKAIL